MVVAMLQTLSESQLQSLTYLTILFVTVVSYALVSRRGRVLQSLRQFVLWGLIIVGVAAGYNLWQGAGLSMAAMQQSTDGRSMALRRGFDGQYHLTMMVQGPSGPEQSINFIVDTGATDMVLTTADATKLGFVENDLRFLGTARTANGVTRTALVQLEGVRLGDHAQHRVRALVNEGDLHASLLGMRFLERFSRIEIANGVLRITY